MSAATSPWLIETLLQAFALGFGILIAGCALEAKYGPLFARLGQP